MPTVGIGRPVRVQPQLTGWHCEPEGTRRSLFTETLVLVRFRDFSVHFWVPWRLLEPLQASVEGEAVALGPRSFAPATSTDVSSRTTLILVFTVLELVANLLVASLECELGFVLPDQFIERRCFFPLLFLFPSILHLWNCLL